jgi:PRTRC genetic system protein E
MFEELFQRMADGDTVTIAITKKDAVLTVSVLPTKQLKSIKPLILTGGAKELDEAFIAEIEGSLARIKEKITTVVVSNKEDVEASISEAKGPTSKKTKIAGEDATERAKARLAKIAEEKPIAPVKINPYLELVAAIEPLLKVKNHVEAIAKIQLAITKLKGEDLKNAKELLFSTQLAKQKAMFNEEDEKTDESADVVIPKKIQPNPEPERRFASAEPEEDEDDDIPIVDDDEPLADDEF